MKSVLKTLLIFAFILTFINSARAIVGGNFAQENEYTYAVSLQANNKHFCGGGIISNRHIITAAHCVMGFDATFRKTPITVMIGAAKLLKPSPTSFRVPVEKIYVPKVYTPQDADFTVPFQLVGDIAVIKLRDEIDFDENPLIVKLKILEDPSLVYSGEKPMIAGYGINEAKLIVDPVTGKKSTKPIMTTLRLKFAETQVLTNEDCLKIKEMTGPMKDSHMCSRVKQRRRLFPESICMGDSGSPLVLNGYVIGVVSTGPDGCDESIETGVYTRISHFLHFIQSAINDEKNPDTQSATWHLINYENCDSLSPVLTVD